MDPKDASRQLENAEVVPCIEGSLAETRELLALCLEAEIPAVLDGKACAKPGCTPKAQLLVKSEDAPRVAALLRNRWQSALAQEGVTPVAVTYTGEGEPPCPACGTAAPLVAGACSDCGLQLE